MIVIQIMSPVSFLKATMMETQKKGRYNFALNLQSIITKHQILITGEYY